jgi:AcrR family transcriptional regulator
VAVTAIMMINPRFKNKLLLSGNQKMKRIVKKPDERKKEIICAARELFQKNEYDKTTMQDIMKYVNIAKGTIYHYFSSKEELLEAVVEDLVDEEFKRKIELMNSDEFQNLNALQKIQSLLTSDHLAEENEHILESLHSAVNSTMHTRQLGRYLTKLSPVFASVIEEGCHQGIFKTAHPLECIELLLAGIQFLTDPGFYSWSEDDLSRRMAAFPTLVETQLGAPEGSFNFLTEQNK